MSLAGAILGGAAISAAGSLLGGRKQSKATEAANDANIRYQKEFAQQGIRWRVEDAQKAGIHPLYAINANVPTFSPTVVADPMGNAVAQAGQAIGRGVAALPQKESIPTGAIVYPLGSQWPHQTDPKTGKAVPLSASQAQSLMAMESHNKQMAVMDAQIESLKPQPQAVPNMFEVLSHPTMGQIPFPNQLLGEVAEALEEPVIRGMWLSQLKRTNEALYSKMQNEAVQGKATTLVELVRAIPGITRETVKALIEELKKGVIW